MAEIPISSAAVERAPRTWPRSLHVRVHQVFRRMVGHHATPQTDRSHSGNLSITRIFKLRMQEIVTSVDSAGGVATEQDDATSTARLLQTKDWSKTRLGARQDWSAGLQSLVSTIQASPLPTILLWGPDLIQIYNDGYAAIMGKKHPWGMGIPTAECWPEVWEFNSAVYDRIWKGESVTYSDQLYPLDRLGYIEETFLTVAYSPAYDGADKIGGVYITVLDNTAKVKSQRALQQSEERFRMALESAQGVGTWDWDVTKDKVYADAGFAKVYGVKPEMAADGLPVSEFTRNMVDEDRVRIESKIARCLETGEEFAGEYRLIGLDGQTRWVSARGRCAFDSQGKPVRFPGLTLDITERKAQESAIRESNERFRALVDASAQVVWATDPDGSIEEESPSWSRYTGQSKEDWLGFGWLSVVHPDDREDAGKTWRAAVQLKAPYQAEYRLWHAPSQTWRWTVARGVPLLNDDGSIRMWIGMNMDVDEQKRATDQLRRSEEKHRFLSEALPQFVWMAHTDESGTPVFDFVNRELRRVTGRNLEELQENGWMDLLHPEDRDRVIEAVTVSLSTGSPFVQEYRIGTANGGWCWYLSRSEQFENVDGSTFWLGTAIEITDRKLAEATLRNVNAELEARVRVRTRELETSNKELEAFSYSVSHDLRAPLRSIDGFSALFEQRYNDVVDDFGRDLLKRTRGAVQHMGELIDALLMLSRVTRSVLNRIPVDLSSMAGSIAEELKARTPERNIQFNIEPKMLVEADPQLMKVAIQNLLENAVKYTGPRHDAVVSVGTKTTPKGQAVFVKDNGVGFDMKYVDKLFGAFQRLHGDKDFRGSGIGLATVQRVVARHGGTVGASGQVNEGAEFYFTLGGA